ncbi:hypothetical protein FB451DRAFT_1193410 [Mycena latifolia]|nr:hypothetical protein FB451DRAFT_1193410 [Mycena latifolia]
MRKEDGGCVDSVERGFRSEADGTLDQVRGRSKDIELLRDGVGAAIGSRIGPSSASASYCPFEMIACMKGVSESRGTSLRRNKRVRSGHDASGNPVIAATRMRCEMTLGRRTDRCTGGIRRGIFEGRDALTVASARRLRTSHILSAAVPWVPRTSHALAAVLRHPLPLRLTQRALPMILGGSGRPSYPVRDYAAPPLRALRYTRIPPPRVDDGLFTSLPGYFKVQYRQSFQLAGRQDTGAGQFYPTTKLGIPCNTGENPSPSSPYPDTELKLIMELVWPVQCSVKLQPFRRKLIYRQLHAIHARGRTRIKYLTKRRTASFLGEAESEAQIIYILRGLW